MNPQINRAYSKSESNISNRASTKNKFKKNIKFNNNTSNLNRNMFEFLFVIGKGGFGKVWRVKQKKTKDLYALKEMSKTKIIDKKSEKSINGEREFLSYLHHPFIVNMHYAFQDNDNLYLVMDLLTGGDLRYHCSRYRAFSEEQTRFFLACIIHSLSYIHKNKVIHRDIKPENLVLDDKGYVHITDFGIAKINMPDNSSETSGTPGYMCPEVMNGKNHSFPADYFSIGVIGYEFMMGRRPYRGRGRKEIKQQMISYQAKIEENEIKEGWSSECVDFINQLLQRKVKKRLGSSNGIKELKGHDWMKYYPWKELSNKSLPAPFIPEKIDNFDKKYCESIDEISEETQIRYEEIMLCTHYNTAFEDFYFNKNEVNRNNDFDYDYEESEETSKKESENNADNTSKKITENNFNIFDKENNDEIIDTNKETIKKEEQENDGITNNNEDKNNKEDNDIKKIKIKKFNNEYLNNQSQNKLTTFKINNNEKQFLLHKNYSDINIINNNKNYQNNKVNYFIPNINNKIEGKTIDNFINIKRINVNYRNNALKLPNQNNINRNKNVEDIRLKYALIPKKFNDFSNLNNNKFNKPIKNIFNINNNEIHNINNNNSNINIFLSVNMFNKMLDNHFNRKKKTFNRNPFQDLLNKQKKILAKDNKNKSLNNRFNPEYQYNNKKRKLIGCNNNNNLLRSNSVGIFVNNNQNFNRNNYNYINSKKIKIPFK